MNAFLQTIYQEDMTELWRLLACRTYDTQDNPASVTDPRSSITLDGNPKTLASTITYLPYGGITGLVYGNNLSLTQEYDNQYRISSIVTGSIVNLTYGYDANGNITSIVDSVNPAGGQPLENPETYTYQTGTNKLIHIETTPPIDFGYDVNANITSETSWTYIYDLSNQLVRVLAGANQVAEYTYNGAGQRIKKVTQTETRIFHYDQMGHLIAETNQSGTMLAEYIYLGDQLLAMITKPSQTEIVSYFHNDHLGTPQVLTNDSQNVVWKAAYTPFGGAEISIETVTNPFRLPGQYYDAETSLHYNYFRYYDPTTGRYVTPDPIGLDGGINLFLYTNNPLNRIDPLGLFVFGSYDQATGKLYLYDLDTGKGIFAEFHSGGPFGAPVPGGMYDILFHGRKRDFYRLEPVDAPYGDDIDQRTGRSEFRLHKPGGTVGCITAKNWNEWRKVKFFIDQTKTSTVEVPSKWISPRKRLMHPTEKLLWYGRIIVIGSE